jgi:hypothetical protein
MKMPISLNLLWTRFLEVAIAAQQYLTLKQVEQAALP